MNIPRYRLQLCSSKASAGADLSATGKNDKNIKWAETIPDKWNGEISWIISFEKRTNRYTVQFKMTNGKEYIDGIPATYLRDNYPQELTEMEKKFMQQIENT